MANDNTNGPASLITRTPIESTSNILKQALGVAPVMFGVAHGWRALKSNDASSLVNLKTNTAQNTAISVGDNLRRIHEEQAVTRDAQAARFREQLTKGTFVKDILTESAESRRAVITSVLETIDNLDLQRNDPALEGIRTSLGQMLESESDDILRNSEKLIEQAVSTIRETSTESVRREFNRSLNSALDIRSQIASPVVSMKGMGGAGYNKISATELGSAATNFYERINNITQRAGGSVSLVSVKEGSVGVSYYAQIRKGNKFITSVPLELASWGGKNRPGEALKIIRSGEALATPYAATPLFGDAPGIAGKMDELQLAAHGERVRLTKDVVQSSFMFPKMGTASIVGTEEFFVRHFEQRMDKVGGNLGMLDSRTFGEHTLSFSEALPRAALQNDEYGRNLLNAYRTRSQHMTVVGMEALNSNRAFHLQPWLAADASLHPEDSFFHPSSKPSVNRGPFGDTMNVGVNTSSMRGGGVVTQVTSLTTARRGQQLGRDTFIFPHHNQANVTVGRRTDRRVYGGNMSVANDMVSGSMNKAIFFDMSEKKTSTRFGIGEGEAIMPGRTNISSPYVKTVLNPKEHNLSSRKLLNRITHATSKGESVYLTRAEILSHKGALGMGPQGREAFIKAHPDMTGMHLRASGSVTGGRNPQHKIHIHGKAEFSTGRTKLFGDLFKGTTLEADESAIRKMLRGIPVGSSGMTAATLFGEAGMDMNRTLFTSGAMLRKSVDNLVNQMVGGLDLLGLGPWGSNGGADDLHAWFAKGAGLDAATLRGAKTPLTQALKLQRATSFATEVLSAAVYMNDISPQMAGSVLGGAHAVGNRFAGKGFASGLEASIRGSFGEGAVAGVMEGIESKAVIGMGSLTAAPTPYLTYGAAKGSIEPRSFKFLAERLRNTMGMNADEVNEVMTSFLARKENIGRDMSVASGLSKTMSTMIGHTSLGDVRAAHKLGVEGPTLMNWEKFTKSVTAGGGGEAAVEALLRQSPDGLALDFTGNRQVQAAAEKAFGGSSSVFLPGGDILENMKGTSIRAADGSSTEIFPQYVRNVKTLHDDLLRISTAQGAGSKAFRVAQDRLGAFRGNMTDLFAGAMTNVTRGSMLGSVFPEGSSLDMLNDIRGGSNAASKARAIRSYRAASGQAVFMNTAAFTDAMKTFMSGATAEGMSREAAKADMSRRFSMFFTGQERGAHQGLVAIGGRYPTLAPSHVTPTQVFRDTREFTGGADRAFQAFTGTKTGSRLARSLKVSSFHDVAGLGRKQKKRFFDAMSQSVDSWAGHGGGEVYIPKMTANVNIKGMGSTQTFNVDWANKMFGDFDSDAYHFTFLSDKSAGKVLGGMNRKSSMQRDFVSAIRTSVFRQQAKAGIAETGKVLSTVAPGAIAENLHKFTEGKIAQEIMAKDVGAIDVAFGNLRSGIVRYGTDETREIAGASWDLLKVLQEDSLLKAKKLDSPVDMGRPLRWAIHQMMGGEGSDAMKSVLKNMTFRGQELATGAVTIQGMSGMTGGASAEMIANLSAGVKGISFDLDSIVDFLQSIANRQPSGVPETDKQLARFLQNADAVSSYEAAIQNRGLEQAAIALGQMSDIERRVAKATTIFDQVSGAASRLDKRLIAPIALGLAGSLAVGAMTGFEGYAPTPLSMPGENMSHRVQSEIAQGTLLSSSTGAGRSSADMGMMGSPDTPINTPETYFARSNAYQVRGSVGGPEAISRLTNFMNGIGGQSSVRINDSRRPITGSYIDRILGD